MVQISYRGFITPEVCGKKGHPKKPEMQHGRWNLAANDLPRCLAGQVKFKFKFKYVLVIPIPFCTVCQCMYSVNQDGWMMHSYATTHESICQDMVLVMLKATTLMSRHFTHRDHELRRHLFCHVFGIPHSSLLRPIAPCWKTSCFIVILSPKLGFPISSSAFWWFFLSASFLDLSFP